MQAPRIPSFFKTIENKSFSFEPRYYDEKKERREKLKKGEKTNLKLNKSNRKNNSKGRSTKIIFLIIILSLLAYNFVIN